MSEIKERTRTLEIPTPVTFNGVTYSQLDLRVPRIGELKKAQTHLKGSPDSDTRMLIILVSLVTGIPELAVEMVDLDVVMEAAEFLLGFMPTPPKTSET